MKNSLLTLALGPWADFDWSSHTGRVYPELRRPDYKRRMRRQTALFAVLVALISAVGIGLLLILAGHGHWQRFENGTPVTPRNDVNVVYVSKVGKPPSVHCTARTADGGDLTLAAPDGRRLVVRGHARDEYWAAAQLPTGRGTITVSCGKSGYLYLGQAPAAHSIGGVVGVAVGGVPALLGVGLTLVRRHRARR